MTIEVVRLPAQDYASTLTQMRNFTLARTADTLDQLWLLEHPPVFTQGQAGKAEHLLNPGNIPVVQSDRGGQVTYHGPGQLIVYFLLDLKRQKLKIRALIDIIEQSVITLLAEYGICANTKANAPGIYVQDAKICSLGLRVREGCSYHGLSLNVAMDLEPFTRINPCGYANMPITQIKDFIPDVCMNSCTDRLTNIVQQQLSKPSLAHEYN